MRSSYLNHSTAGDKIVSFIDTYTRNCLRPPSVREIQIHMSYGSPRAVSYHLEKLVDAKRLKRLGEGSRNYAVA